MKIIRPTTIDAAALIATNATETVAIWAAGTTYALGARVRSDATHRTYESLINANTGNDPTTDDGTRWLNVAPTNAWAMFDEFNQTQTTRAVSIDVTLAPAGLVDSLALLNLDAAEVTVTMTDDVAGEVYNETFSLVFAGNVGSDFYAWCFEPIIRQTDLHIEGLPAYSDPTVDVVIAAPAGIAKCGNLVIGRQRELGATTYGFTFGIIDRSRKDEDDFGNITIVERSCRKSGSFDVIVPRQLIDEVGRLLALYRARPIVYVGTGNFAASIYYGFFRDFRVAVENYAEGKLSIQIEGLT